MVELIDIVPVGHLHGEGVQWNADDGCLWWTDISGCALHRYALEQRQLWWRWTTIATALGLFLFLRFEQPWLKLVAMVLMLLPHIVGAPHPAAPESKVPAEVAAHFAALSLGIQAALWLATAYMVGVLWPWVSRRAAAVG